MSIVERNGRYYVTVGAGATRFRASTTSLKHAKLLESRELTKRGQSPTGNNDQMVVTVGVPTTPAKPKVTLGTLLEIARKTRWSKAESKAGHKLYGTAKQMVEILGYSTDPKAVTGPVIRNLAATLVEQGNSGGTVNRKMSALSVLMRIAEEDGHIEQRPRMSRRRESEHRIRFLDAAEERKVLDYLNHIGAEDLIDFVVVAIDTGFRRGELLKFRIDRFYNGMLHLERGETKNNKPRAVPATSRVEAIIAKRKASGLTYLFEGFTEYMLRRQWELLREAMGALEDPQFVVHMLRHTCASRLAMGGKNAAFIKMWMGHSTILTTERYMHLSPDTLREGIGTLEGYVPQGATVAHPGGTYVTH